MLRSLVGSEMCIRDRSKGKNKINEIIDSISDIDSNIKEKLQLYSQINKISDDNDFYNSSSSSDNTCQCKQINMIKRNTLKSPKMTNSKTATKELIFDMIQQIPDPEKQKEHLEKLKTLIIDEDEAKDTLVQPFSISKHFETYPITTKLNAQPNNIQELRTEVKSLKEEIKIIKQNLAQMETKNLAYDTQICIIQAQLNKGKEIATISNPLEENPPFPLDEITISTNEPYDSNFISTIKGFSYQKWFVFITLRIYNSKSNFTAMIDSGADHSVIRDGIFPTKYYEPTSEKLVTANDSPLKVKGKLTKTSICNNKVCFKHQFIIVDDLNTDVILGIPFLTQIYPFWVDSTGLGTKIMGEKILFKFITPIKYKELNTLQTNSIYQSINKIKSYSSKTTSSIIK